MSTKSHQHHFIIVGAAVAIALLLGIGAGWVALFALLGCAAMIGVVAWFAFDSGARSAERAPTSRDAPTNLP